MIQAPHLKIGDVVYITSPAKAIGEETVMSAKLILESWGLKVLISPHCTGRLDYFSGTDEQRKEDFQKGLDDPNIKAILCARGGYGCVRIVEELNWEKFQNNPKWIVGFSDVTVFHQKLQQLGIESIHGIMPLGFCDGTEEAKSTLRNALFGQAIPMECPWVSDNILGETEGLLVGGNMTIVQSLLGTPLSYTFENKILFLEDVGEHIYKIDRMLHSLQLAGVFNQIKGLILGGFTEMEDTDVPFGKTINELVVEKVGHLGIPVAFDVPFGHIKDNRTMVVGRTIKLIVAKEKTTLLI